MRSPASMHRPAGLVSAVRFQCINCGDGRSRPLYTDCPDYYVGTPVRVDYVACAACGLVQQSAPADDMLPFYADYPVHEPSTPLVDWLRRLVTRGVYFDVPSGSPHLTVVDYGCGNGAYLKSMLGREFNLVGYEPAAEHADRLSQRLGLQIYSDVNRLVLDYSGRVDLVTMHFALEHVTDLDAVFSTLSALLRPGGLSRIVVPNVDSWEARLFGKRWHGLDPPRHVSFPNGPVVGALAARHGLGLRAVHHVAFPNTIAGSIPTVVLGRFAYWLFLVCLPLGLVCSRVAPSGSTVFWLARNA